MSDVTDGQGHRLDQIRLVGVTATGYHGVFEHERREGQTFVVDVVVHLDTRRAAARDDLEHTLDYGALAQQVVAVIEGPPADLIETVAERIAATVLADGSVAAVDVAVHKPQAPIPVPFGDVVVAIRRDRGKLPAAEPHRGEIRPQAAPAPSSASGPTPQAATRPLTHTAALPVTGPQAPAPQAPAPQAPAPSPQAAPQGPVTGPPSSPVTVPTAPLASAAVEPAIGALAGPLGGAAVAPPLVPLPKPGDLVVGGPLGGGAMLHPADETPIVASGPPTTSTPAVTAAPGPAQAPVPPADATQIMPPLSLAELDEAAQRDEAAYGDTYREPVPVGRPVDDPGRDVAVRDDEVVQGEVLTDRLDETPSTPVEAVLALGANLGNAQETLRQAVGDLDRTPGIDVVDVSPLARTAAVGGPADQPDFLNAVVLVRTLLSPRDLLHAVQAVEQTHGRERLEHWGPRTLDVDVIVYGSVLAVTDDLELPHPRAHERAFVLQPWAQVDPDAVLPGLGGGPVAALAATAPDREGVRWLALDWLTAPVPAAQWDVDEDGRPGPGT